MKIHFTELAAAKTKPDAVMIFPVGDDKKLSPYIVPWTELPKEIRAYDVNAVAAFPEILKAGGYHLKLVR